MSANKDGALGGLVRPLSAPSFLYPSLFANSYTPARLAHSTDAIARTAIIIGSSSQLSPVISS